MSPLSRPENAFAAPLRSGAALADVFSFRTLFQVFQVLRRRGMEAPQC